MRALVCPEDCARALDAWFAVCEWSYVLGAMSENSDF